MDKITIVRITNECNTVVEKPEDTAELFIEESRHLGVDQTQFVFQRLQQCLLIEVIVLPCTSSM